MSRESEEGSLGLHSDKVSKGRLLRMQHWMLKREMKKISVLLQVPVVAVVE